VTGGRRRYALDAILEARTAVNEPCSYRDLVLRRQYNTTEYTVARSDEDGVVAKVDVDEFDAVEELRRRLDQLSNEVDTDPVPVEPPLADGGAARTHHATAGRSWSVDVSAATLMLVVGVLLVVSAGAAANEMPVSAALQFVGGLALAKFGHDRRDQGGGRR
jgi:hypothetical protein